MDTSIKSYTFSITFLFLQILRRTRRYNEQCDDQTGQTWTWTCWWRTSTCKLRRVDPMMQRAQRTKQMAFGEQCEWTRNGRTRISTCTPETIEKRVNPEGFGSIINSTIHTVSLYLSFLLSFLFTQKGVERAKFRNNKAKFKKEG